MTVREKVGRRRYVYIERADPSDIRRLEGKLAGSRVLNYKGIRVLSVKNDQLQALRKFAGETGLDIRMISGTLKALSRKVSELKR